MERADVPDQPARHGGECGHGPGTRRCHLQTTLDLLASLAARTDAFWIENSGNPPTQYIVFDGLNSGYPQAITNVPAFIGSLYPAQHYTQIYTADDVYVFRRG